MADVHLPQVSILMAVHNEERFLPLTLDALLGQTLQDFELICVDDGSQDQTAHILQEYQQRNAHLRVLTNPTPQGLTISLNKALDQAEGTYIARADADDLYHPERLAKQVTYLEAHPDVVLLSSQRVDIDEHGQPLKVQKNSPLTNTAMRWRMLFDSPCLHSVVMWRASVNLRYNEAYRVAQDYELWSRMAQKGKMAALPERLLLRRVHTKSISAKRGGEQAENRDQVSLHMMQQAFGESAPDCKIIDRWRQSFIRPTRAPKVRDIVGYVDLLARYCEQQHWKNKARLLWQRELTQQAKHLFLAYRWHLLPVLGLAALTQPRLRRKGITSG